jgi:hypothetical protein
LFYQQLDTDFDGQDKTVKLKCVPREIMGRKVRNFASCYVYSHEDNPVSGFIFIIVSSVTVIPCLLFSEIEYLSCYNATCC